MLFNFSVKKMFLKVLKVPKGQIPTLLNLIYDVQIFYNVDARFTCSDSSTRQGFMVFREMHQLRAQE
jgi:hypothetical protein